MNSKLPSRHKTSPNLKFCFIKVAHRANYTNDLYFGDNSERGTVGLKKSEFSIMILFLFCFPGDPRNYDDYPETDFRKVPPVTDREQRLFDDF